MAPKGQVGSGRSGVGWVRRVRRVARAYGVWPVRTACGPRVRRVARAYGVRVTVPAPVTLVSVLTMQDALRRLSDYWTREGCLTVQPFNTEVGAGTMNPATVLRVLGPEPWDVAYVEPRVRPDDSRYGENPNRLQTHTQFQVILKPEPGDPQELYLGSLEALGIDLHAHDVRFVEDNWQQPAIGAWGLGWEVWLDGMEITQFTYFQQVGGQNLDPVPVELTYGMERILMAQSGRHALQGHRLRHAAGRPARHVRRGVRPAEYEMSRYYLDDADVETNRRLYETYVARGHPDGRGTAARCRPTTSSSSPATPSTCSTPAARSRRPSAPRRSRRCAASCATRPHCGSSAARSSASR